MLIDKMMGQEKELSLEGMFPNLSESIEIASKEIKEAHPAPAEGMNPTFQLGLDATGFNDLLRNASREIEQEARQYISFEDWIKMGSGEIAAEKERIAGLERPPAMKAPDFPTDPLVTPPAPPSPQLRERSEIFPGLELMHKPKPERWIPGGLHQAEIRADTRTPAEKTEILWADWQARQPQETPVIMAEERPRAERDLAFQESIQKQKDEEVPFIQGVKDLGLLISLKHPGLSKKLISEVAKGVSFGNEEYFYRALEKDAGLTGLTEAMRHAGEEDIREVLGYYPQKAMKVAGTAAHLAGAAIPLSRIFKGATIVAKAASTTKASRVLIRAMIGGSAVALMRRPEGRDTLRKRIEQIPGDVAFFTLFEAGALTAGQALKIAKWNKQYGKLGKTKEFRFTEKEVQDLYSKMNSNLAGRGEPLTQVEAELTELLKAPPGWKKAIREGWIGKGFVSEGKVTFPEGGKIPRKPRFGDIFREPGAPVEPTVPREPEAPAEPGAPAERFLPARRGVTPEAPIAPIEKPPMLPEATTRAPEAIEPITPAPVIPEEPPTVTTEPALKPEYGMVEVPVSEISMAEEIPNFKGAADTRTGVVPSERLQGTYDRLGTAPVVVWQKSSGEKAIVTGRHRLDLARRSGEETIPAQVVYEDQGFTRAMALTIDAESNIRDGMGDVRDYAQYFKNTEISEAEATERGLLSRIKGKNGWGIGKSAIDDVYNAYLGRQIPEAKAIAIARGAPGNESAQRAALSRINKYPPEELESFAALLANTEQVTMAPEAQGGLFGFDDSAVREAEAVAKEVAKETRATKDRILSVQGALRRPELARNMGLEFTDEPSLREEVARLERRTEDLKRVHTNPELYDEMRKRAGLLEFEPEPQAFAEKPVEPPIASHAGEGGWSPEAISRAKETEFFLYDTKTKKPTPITGIDAIDVSPGPTQMKFQRNLKTGEITLLDKGEKVSVTPQQIKTIKETLMGEPGEPRYIRRGKPGPREAVSKEEALKTQERYYYEVLGGKPGTFDPSQMEPGAFKGETAVTLPYRGGKQIGLFKEEKKPAKLTPVEDKRLKKEQLTETVIDVTKGKKGRKKDLVAKEQLKKELPGVLKRMNIPRERWGSLTAERLLKGGFDPSMGTPVENYIRTLLAKRIFDAEGNIKDGKERPIAISELAAPDLLDIKPAMMGRTAGDPSIIFKRENAKQKIRDVLSDYLPSERDFDVFASRILKDYPDTFEVIGKRHGISNQRAQQVWNENIAKLRKNKDFVKWVEDNLSWKGMGPAPSPKDLREMNLIWKKYFTTSRGVGLEISRENQARSNDRMAELFLGSLERKKLRKWLHKNDSIEVKNFIHDLVTGQASLELYAIPGEIKDSIKAMRARIDRLTDMIILYGDLPEDTQDILRAHMGEYLIGRFRAWEKVIFKPDPEMKRKYIEYLKETDPDEYGSYTKEEMNKFLRGEINKYRKNRFKTKSPIAISGEQLAHKKKMPKAKRDYYGEIIDVPWLYMQTISKQTSMAYNAKFLSKIATAWDQYWTDSLTEARKNEWQNTRIPEDMGYGKLRNKYVAPELYDFITGIYEKEMGWIRKTVENFIVQPFKWNRTIAVPAGHGRNLFANPMFAILARCSPLNPMNLQYYIRFTKYAIGRSGKYKNEWADFIRRGIVGTQFWGAEVGGFYEDLVKMDPLTWPEKIYDYAKKPGKAVIATLGELWNFGDTLFRGAADIKNREHYKMSPQASTEEIDRCLPNYKNLPAAVDFLRKVPIMGTFVSFNANVVKIFSNQVTRGLAEMEAGLGFGNPLEAYGGTAEGDMRGGRKPPEPGPPEKGDTGWHKGARNPDPDLFWRGAKRWMRTVLMLYAADIMVDLSMKISGVDKKLAKGFDKFRNTFQKGGKFIWIPWKGGFKLFDMTYIWPPAEFPLKTIDSLIKGDLAGVSSSANVLAHPTIDAVNILINGKKAGSDRDLPQTETDLMNLGQRLMEFAKFIWVPQSAPIPDFKDLMKDLKIKPGPWTPRNTAKVLDAYWQKPDRLGRVKDFGEEMKNFFTGLKTWDIDVDKTIYYYIKRLERKANLLEGDVASWVIDHPFAPEWKEKEYAAGKNKIIERLNKDIKIAGDWYEEFTAKEGFRVKE